MRPADRAARGVHGEEVRGDDAPAPNKEEAEHALACQAKATHHSELTHAPTFNAFIRTSPAVNYVHSPHSSPMTSFRRNFVQNEAGQVLKIAI